ncbi:L,D-transpeptidase [Chelativorans sp. ZYF759]|uniref:L,D-transpeptidase n=1 Tax=Chelativorans sp. ZYF759 TaxID=2692213 RepID=UPI001AEE55BC|nr:L,D-transpeptidase [Chelativorans sp. ZYF759]
MIDRRRFLLGLAFVASPVYAYAHPQPFVPDPDHVPQEVEFLEPHPIGTLVVDTDARYLYLILGEGLARRYGIGVGRAGLAWQGQAEIGRKAKWPGWRPTANMIRRQPEKYARYANGVPGGPNNPLGSRALYLYRDGRDTMYRIHGTTEPWTIGQAISNGCVRLINEHVEDLFERVQTGAQVIVR